VAHRVMTAVASYTTAKRLGVDPLHELRENGFARMHACILAIAISKKMRRKKRGRVEIAHTSFSTQVASLQRVPKDPSDVNRIIVILDVPEAAVTRTRSTVGPTPHPGISRTLLS
jgi:hypothetical protein